MKAFTTMPADVKNNIRFILTDIDDTLTNKGRLRAEAYTALETLREAGYIVIPITGRPAGWCDHIARMWPVDGVVGENGAFYFRYNTETRRMVRCYATDDALRAQHKIQLAELGNFILNEVCGCAISADQAYREADIAIDFCEDVPALPMATVEHIKELCTQAGATAKISSIHVNAWFGEYDKLGMTARIIKDEFGMDMEAIREQVIYAGDSPNDAPMFGYFPHSVGVANVLEFEDTIEHKPTWITEGRGGKGFAELAQELLTK
ncbi:MAG: HAD-IIB family hydrolase [Desulfovibrionales bacterium]|nr:HAD-IIB family hydrolase [Desulfovibrionales bacterium]